MRIASASCGKGKPWLFPLGKCSEMERNFQAFSEFDQKSKKYETAKPALIWVENPDDCLVKA